MKNHETLIIRCDYIGARCGDVCISPTRAVADATMPIIARLTKHRKTLLNIVKHHETLVQCDT